MHILEDCARTSTAGVIHDKAQGTVQILACGQHYRQFTRNLAQFSFVEAALTAKLEV